MTILHSPLDQFKINVLSEITIGGYDISITNSTIFMMLVLLLIVYFLQSTSKQGNSINLGNVLGLGLYQFILKLVVDNIHSKESTKYFPFIYSLFLFIVLSNLIGMIPYSFTVTSHFVVTFGFSFTIFIAVTLIGLQKHGLHFFTFFIPTGAPMYLLPLLIPIEIISYLSRAFSLGIRLFANMMSGHSLLKILAGFSFSMIQLGGIFYVVQLVPLVIVFLVTGLELGVALLQAYVFSILTCMYLNDAINLH
uniref:ATP synthase subunit a n=1 Tax=Imasa heleensis TaxID=2772037 RepID=A0A893DD00_9EUKA|nr:ATP synthase F0 subunit a [Imasa heleensis]QRR29739.1 ATP synthase F0 subunit a [Imasa heleensis]